MPTVPPLVSVAPDIPNPDEPATFSVRAFPYTTWLSTVTPQIASVSTNVYNNSLEAFNNAASALTYRDEADVAAVRAGAYSTAIPWVSGVTYNSGTSVYSLVDYLTYRRSNTGAGTTDPKYDRSNYECLHNLASLPNQAVSGNPIFASINIHYLLNGFTVLVLPFSPPDNSFLEVSNLSGGVNSVIACNGKKLGGIVEDMFFNKPNETIRLLYVSSAIGWVFQ